MAGWSPTYPTASEMAGSVEEKLRFDGMHTGKVVVRCAWADRFAVAADMINRAYPNGIGGLLGAEAVIKPEAGQPTLDSDGKLVYEFALVSVNYDVASVGSLETYPSGPHAGELYSEALVPTVENQTLPVTGFTWTNATGRALVEGENPVRILRGMAIKRTLFNVSSIHADYFTLPGKVNSASYTSVPLGKVFAAETLLFVPQEISRTVTTAGSDGWTVPMLLKYKEDGWNKFWRKDKSGGAGYDEIYDRVNSAVYKNFPTASFANLLY